MVGSAKLSFLVVFLELFPVTKSVIHFPILRCMPASVVGMPVCLVNQRFSLVMPSNFFQLKDTVTPGKISVPAFLRLRVVPVVVVVVVTVTPFLVVFLVVVYLVAISLSMFSLQFSKFIYYQGYGTIASHITGSAEAVHGYVKSYHQCLCSFIES